MAYIKQNFEDGQTLKAEHLNAMEQGIADVSKHIVVSGGDTLTWDGNTSGLVMSDDGGYIKLTDVVFSVDDCPNGASVVDLSGEAIEYSASEIVDINGTTRVGTDFYGVVSVPSAMTGITFEDIGCAFPEPGTYFAYFAGFIEVRSFTIPGYTGFITEKLDPKVLPDALQFGETTVQGDTLMWDGNTGGLFAVYEGDMPLLYKISDTRVTRDDFANGFFVMIDGDIVANKTGEEALSLVMEDGAFFIEGLFYIPADNYDFEGLLIPQAGWYHLNPMVVNNLHVGIVIPGVVFESIQTVEIDDRYIPDSVVRKTDLVQPDWEQTDETAADFIKNKPITKGIDLCFITVDSLERLSERGSANTPMTFARFKEIRKAYPPHLITLYGNPILLFAEFTDFGAAVSATCWRKSGTKMCIDFTPKFYYTAEASTSE